LNLPHKDFTKQEQTIASVLDELGLRYVQQEQFFNYFVDFWLPELLMVVEADGMYGHFGKREKKRNEALLTVNVIDHVLHIKATSKKEIKEILCKEIDKISGSLT
jgi:very-short-patch-repair endonuclease